MKFATSVIATIFLFIAIFGFAVMCQDTATGHESMSNVSMTVSHIAAYQSFSNTTVPYFVALLATLVFCFVIISQVQRTIISVGLVDTLESRDRHRIDPHITSWLSLFELSPSFV